MHGTAPEHSTLPETAPAPLAGIRVVELDHMVMGPACGLILADLGYQLRYSSAYSMAGSPEVPAGVPGDVFELRGCSK